MKKIFYLLLISTLSFAQFTTEINKELLQKTWNASWITHPESKENGYEVFHFRKSFPLTAKPSKFIVHVSADSRYWLFVNGQRICTGPAKGDLAHWRFESLDISSYLKPGQNTIAAIVWSQGAYASWSQFTYKTGFLLQGNSEAEVLVNTNESWLTYKNEAYQPFFETHRVVGARESFLAEKNPFGWELPDFNDKNWIKSVTTEKAIPFASTEKSSRKLVQRAIPLPEEISQRFGEIRTITGAEKNDNFIKGTGDLVVNPWGNVSIIIDQKTLTTAYPELVYSGGKGGKITLTYMEAPFINVANEEKGNRNEIEGKIIDGIHDAILPDGSEKRTFRPLYYRTFRYVHVKIENHLQPLKIHDFYSKFTGYPFRENASFMSNDPSLSDIWNVGWRTARLCAFETYMDCPYYEQLQYVGDTRIQALISLYVSGDERLMKNAINQYSDSRIAEGLTQSRYPSNLEQIIPPFSLFWTLMVHDFWWHRQDDAFVKSHIQGIKEVLAWYESKIDPKTGMLGELPHWNFVDWPKEWPWTGQERGSGMPKNADNGGSSIHTLQYAFALEKAAQILESYGMKAEAVRYNELAKNLKEATYKICWDEKRKLMADVPNALKYSQHANVMAVLANVVKGQEAKDLLQKIVADTSLIQCTVYFRFYLNQAMKKAGLGNEYIPMLEPWRNMLKMGLTTFAEKPEPSRSDCHAWSASPNYDLLATVIGAEPSSAGFKTIRIAPNLGKLTAASGKIPHPVGNVIVNLKRVGRLGIEASITLPATLTGVFVWNGKEVKLKSGEQRLSLTK